MYLYNKNNDGLILNYKIIIDYEDIDKLLSIFEEYLNSIYIKIRGEELFKPGEIVCDHDEFDKYRIILNPSKMYNYSRTDQKLKKISKKYIDYEYKKYKNKNLIYEFDTYNYLIGSLLELLNQKYSVDQILYLLDIRNNTEKVIKEFLSTLKNEMVYYRSTHDFEFNFSDFIDKETDENAFLEICESVNKNEKLLNEILKKYPAINILRKMIPYINLVPDDKFLYDNDSERAKKLRDILKKYYENYPLANWENIMVRKYQKSQFNERLANALNVKFKSIGKNEIKNIETCGPKHSLQLVKKPKKNNKDQQ